MTFGLPHAFREAARADGLMEEARKANDEAGRERGLRQGVEAERDR